ncbi:MAG: hypothetical protein RKO25_03890 [Candidatus Contendobacter sp.]|nr:hypothetical protein [Candidatus Contendobacter sp.]
MSASARSVVVSRGALVLVAPWWRRLVGSALWFGAARWRVRASSRAFSGAVVVVGFSCFGRAAAFASAWSAWCGFPVVVAPRAGAGGRLWAVSVPVAPPARLALAAPSLPSRCWWFRGR